MTDGYRRARRRCVWGVRSVGGDAPPASGVAAHAHLRTAPPGSCADLDDLTLHVTAYTAEAPAVVRAAPARIVVIRSTGVVLAGPTDVVTRVGGVRCVVHATRRLT